MNNIWIYLSPLITALLTYFIAISGKKKDVDIEKNKKLNVVISNLLDVWNYLDKLKDISNLNKADISIPFKFLPYILLNSKSLNDKVFTNLEDSICLLKEYDPIIYYELSGLGFKFDEVKTNYILPFLNSNNQSNFTRKVSDTLISEIIQQIEEYLLLVSKQLNFKVNKRIKRKFDNHTEKNIEEIKKELIEIYYNLIITLIPENEEKPTLEEFEKNLNSSEVKESLEKQLELFKNADLGKVMNIVAENPYASIEEIKEKIS